MSEQVIVVAAGPGERRRARREARANPGARVVVRARSGWTRFSVQATDDGRIGAEFLFEHSRGGRVTSTRHELPAWGVRPVLRFCAWHGYPPRWHIVCYERRLPGEAGWTTVPWSAVLCDTSPLAGLLPSRHDGRLRA